MHAFSDAKVTVAQKYTRGTLGGVDHESHGVEEERGRVITWGVRESVRGWCTSAAAVDSSRSDALQSSKPVKSITIVFRKVRTFEVIKRRFSIEGRGDGLSLIHI